MESAIPQRIWQNYNIKNKVDVTVSLQIISSSYTPPPLNWFVEIQKLFSNFFWHGKRPKIRKTVLFADKQNGGLKLPNVEFKNIALKAGWVQRLNRAGNIFTLHNFLFDNELFWKCNFEPKDCPEVFSKINLKFTFWQDVVTSWSKANFSSPRDALEVAGEILWFNSHIKIGQKLLFHRNLIACGILKIDDLCDQNGFFPYQQFKIKYPEANIDFVTYSGIIRAIPIEWKQMLMQENWEAAPDTKPLMDKILRAKNSTAPMIYNVLLEQFAEFPQDTINKWNTDLGRVV